MCSELALDCSKYNIIAIALIHLSELSANTWVFFADSVIESGNQQADRHLAKLLEQVGTGEKSFGCAPGVM